MFDFICSSLLFLASEDTQGSARQALALFHHKSKLLELIHYIQYFASNRCTNYPLSISNRTCRNRINHLLVLECLNGNDNLWGDLQYYTVLYDECVST